MKRFAAAALLGLSLIGLVTGVVSAYNVPIDKQVSLSGACTSGENLRTTVVDSNGEAVAGQEVTWRITSSPSSADSLRDETTTTDSAGVTTNSIDVDDTPGKRVITVTARDASATMTLNCGSGGLPRTDTAPAPTTPVWGLVAAMIVALAGAAVVRRRVRG